MGPHPAQMINEKQRDGVMESNLGLRTLPKTLRMTSDANVLATYPKTDPPTLDGVHTHIRLLFSPISPPLPELAHTTRRASEADLGPSRSASRNPTLGSSLRKPLIKRCRKVSPPPFLTGFPEATGRVDLQSREKNVSIHGSGWPPEALLSTSVVLLRWGGGGGSVTSAARGCSESS